MDNPVPNNEGQLVGMYENKFCYAYFCHISCHLSIRAHAFQVIQLLVFEPYGSFNSSYLIVKPHVLLKSEELLIMSDKKNLATNLPLVTFV